jgi:peptidoglycan/xylan/chitin deacetylase (PgdA/CDA1 family)
MAGILPHHARTCSRRPEGSREPGGESLTVRAPVDRLLRRSPLQLAFRRRAARRLTVLAYHGVDDPASFARQLDHLARAAHPVSLDEVVAALSGRRGLPPRAVLITFDDGHRSVLEAGLPLLRERGLPAVAFVVAGLLDTDEPFWWVEAERLLAAGGLAPTALVRRLKALPDAERLRAIAELRETAPAPAPRTPQLRREELPQLESAGIAVENHTWSHPCLPRCDDAKATAEALDAHRVLRDALGREPRAFAYPNGDWDARTERALADAGYAAAFLFDHRVNGPAPGHPLRLSRVRVNSDTGPDRFAILLSGLHPALHHARGRP